MLRGFLALAAVLCAAPAEAASLRLAWSDEFETGALDPTRWRVAEDCWGGGNGEKQCYRAANVTVADGVLRLTARQEWVRGPARPDGSGEAVLRPYSSGRIDTRGKAAFRYGRIEVRAKLPEGQGLWPAIWMLPADDVYGAFPASGEIDIAEAVNLGARCDACRDEVHGAVHHGPPGGPSRQFGGRIDFSPADRFHVFALEWTPDRMTWRVDGRPFFSRRTRAPFDQPFYLILNLAVGGRWPESTGQRFIDGAALPRDLVVDWVRVYEPAP